MGNKYRKYQNDRELNQIVNSGVSKHISEMPSLYRVREERNPHDLIGTRSFLVM